MGDRPCWTGSPVRCGLPNFVAMSTEKPEQLELIIVGGGPIGIACGLEAQKNGTSFGPALRIHDQHN